MSKSIVLPTPNAVGYREALRRAKAIGLIAGNPKREALETAIARHNEAIAPKPRLTPEQLYGQAINRLRAIDWAGIHKVPMRYRKRLYVIVVSELKDLWGIE